MIQYVLDASVVLKWFRGEGERRLAAARSLRATFERGELVAFAPPLLRLEIVNVAGRRRLWSEAALVELAEALGELRLELREPDSTGRTLDGPRPDGVRRDYVAVAEAEGIRLVTDDDLILSKAPEIAAPLPSISDGSG